ncbi:MAG: PAS domain S-box protein [Methanoregula sp.]|nr:PAS domain S-box protein [Methanoregula sp.]
MEKKSILIVEDEQIAAVDLREILVSLGYRVTGIASSGERAIQLVETEPPDLILMDILLHGRISGIQTAEQILEHHAIPIIYVTAYADPELIGRAKTTRPYGYIIKPYDERLIRTDIEIAFYKFGLDQNFQREFADLKEWLLKKTGELALADESLRRSEKKYRTLFENMLDGFAYCQMIYDEQGRPTDWIYLDVNAAFERLTGLKGMTGKRVLEAIPDIRNLNPELFDMYGRVASSGIPEVFEIDFKPLKMWLKVSVFSPGKGYFVAVFDDISERKRAEDALKESEEKYRTILENMQDLFYRTDLNGKITMMSPAGARFSGYDSVEDMIGLDAASMYAEPEKRNDILRALAEKGSVTDYPLILKVRDGSIRYATTNSHFFRDQNGKIVGTEGIIHDVTGLRKAKDALRMANKKLNLLSGITRHDIRNQLMALKAYINLCGEELDDRNQLAAFLGKMDQIADTIEDQIGFTRMYEDMGIKSPVWQNVDVLVRDAAASLPLRQVKVEQDCPGLEVVADPLLGKVFYNLIDNALRYGGTMMTVIKISSREIDAGLVVSIEDNGTGISAEDKKRLFERGFGKHTGLGLFLSREILAITGITITENGIAGKGARFEILVPKGVYRFTRN